MKSEDFEVEDRKYSYLWANGYKSANWKHLAKALVKRARLENPAPRVIDFGSGRGDAVAYFSKKGFPTTGVDISRFAIEKLVAKGYRGVWGSLDSLAQIGTDSFEYGFSNDVLEHIEEPYVSPSLREMKRICTRRIFLSICPVPSKNKSREGGGLHLTVRPKTWWEKRLNDIGEWREIKMLFARSIRYEIRLGE